MKQPAVGVPFLGLPSSASLPNTSEVVLIACPLEASVSYGSGTASGPQAILEASCQVELYDREFEREMALDYGIHTADPINVGGSVIDSLERLATRVAEFARQGKLVGVLGGEHTISLGTGRGLLRGLGGPLTVVIIDAHADYRDQYEGDRLSHASVARRLAEEPGVEQILHLGVRSVCPEEVAFARSSPDRYRVWSTEEIHQGGWQDEFRARLKGRRVFFSLDVDGLDPSIVPATGTPEPFGLTWLQTEEIFRLAAPHVVGFDCVELAPQPGLHYAEFAVAKLVYRLINLVKASNPPERERER